MFGAVWNPVCSNVQENRLKGLLEVQKNLKSVHPVCRHKSGGNAFPSTQTISDHDVNTGLR